MKARPHQAKAIARGLRENFVVAHGCGTGKTYTAINWLYMLKPALVVAPISIIETVWLPEIKKCRPKLRIRNLHGLNPKLLEAELLKQDHDVYILNPSLLIRHYASIMKCDFKTAVVDEASLMKNPFSRQSSCLLALAGIYMRGSKWRLGKVIPHRFPMSGTPAPNGHEEWWPVVKFATGRGDRCLPDDYARFRAIYMRQEHVTPTRKRWVFRQRQKDYFYANISEVVDVVKTEDVLPDLQDWHEVRSVKLSTPEWKAYSSMVRDFVIEYGNDYVIADNALSQLLQLRELTSGFVYGRDKEVTRFGNTKFNECENILQEIGDHQCIIWYHFRAEREQLKKLPDSVAIPDNQVERVQVIKDFQAGKIKRLIANPMNLAHGQQFHMIRYAIYFSMSASYEQYEQSYRRLMRGGQENTCGFYYIAAKHTYDEVLLDTWRHKGNISDAALNFLRN